MTEFLGLRWWDRLLLEEPWAVVGMLLLMALALLAIARRRQERRLIFLAGLTGALAAGVYGLSVWVETPLEQVTRQTREVVLATAPLNLTTLQASLDPQVSLLGPLGETWIESGSFLPVFQRSMRMYRFKSNTAVNMRPEIQSPGVITVELKVRTILESTELVQAIPTTWRLTWVHTQEGRWRITSVQWLMLGNQNPSPNYLTR